MSDLESGKKSAIKRAFNSKFRDLTEGRSEVDSPLDYFGVYAMGIFCLVVPLLTAFQGARQQATIEGKTDVFEAVVLFGQKAYIEFGLVVIGIVLCMCLRSQGSLIAMIGRWMAKLFLVLFVAIFSLGLFLGTGSNQTMYFAGQDAKQGLKADKAIIADYDRQLARLQLEYDKAHRRKCWTEGYEYPPGHRCLNIVARDSLSTQLSDLEAKRGGLQKKVESVATSGYGIVLSLFRFFGSTMDRDQIIGLLSTIYSALSALGTVLAPWVMSTIYYEPWVYRKARKRAIHEFGDKGFDYSGFYPSEAGKADVANGTPDVRAADKKRDVHTADMVGPDEKVVDPSGRKVGGVGAQSGREVGAHPTDPGRPLVAGLSGDTVVPFAERKETHRVGAVAAEVVVTHPKEVGEESAMEGDDTGKTGEEVTEVLDDTEVDQKIVEACMAILQRNPKAEKVNAMRSASKKVFGSRIGATRARRLVRQYLEAALNAASFRKE